MPHATEAEASRQAFSGRHPQPNHAWPDPTQSVERPSVGRSCRWLETRSRIPGNEAQEVPVQGIRSPGKRVSNAAIARMHLAEGILNMAGATVSVPSALLPARIHYGHPTVMRRTTRRQASPSRLRPPPQRDARTGYRGNPLRPARDARSRRRSAPNGARRGRGSRRLSRPRMAGAVWGVIWGVNSSIRKALKGKAWLERPKGRSGRKRYKTRCLLRKRALGDTGLEPVTSCVSRIGLNQPTIQEKP